MGRGLKQFILLVSISACFVAQCSAFCPDHWVYNKLYCYRHFGQQVTWEVARNSCRYDYDSELVSIHSTEENDFVYELWRSNTEISCVKHGYWIGANDRAEEGTFVNSDGSPFDYDNWRLFWPYQHQPDNYGAGEDCTHVWYRDATADSIKGWNDRNCDATQPYVCKRRPTYWMKWFNRLALP